MLSCKIDKTGPSASFAWAGTNTTLTGSATDNSITKIVGWAIDTSSTKSPSASGWNSVSATSSISGKTGTATIPGAGQSTTYYFHVKDEAGNVTNESDNVHGQPKQTGTTYHYNTASNEGPRHTTDYEISSCTLTVNTWTNWYHHSHNGVDHYSHPSSMMYGYTGNATSKVTFNWACDYPNATNHIDVSLTCKHGINYKICSAGLSPNI